MPFLHPNSRDKIPEHLHRLWDACEENYPQFKNLWATMAHSPIIFRHIWGELLELKRSSPVEAKHFELAIVIASALTACNYCVSHHSPRVASHGYTVEQLNVLDQTKLTSKPEWIYSSLFSEIDNLVMDLSYHLVWSGTYGQAHKVPQRIIYENKKRIFQSLEKFFGKQQIEELVWRITQCVAFNWHNDFLEIDIEEEVVPLLE